MAARRLDNALEGLSALTPTEQLGFLVLLRARLSVNMKSWMRHRPFPRKQNSLWWIVTCRDDQGGRVVASTAAFFDPPGHCLVGGPLVGGR